jgi:hypothetical protein
MKSIKTIIVITMLLSIVGLTACSVEYRQQHPGYGHGDRGHGDNRGHGGHHDRD